MIHVKKLIFFLVIFSASYVYANTPFLAKYCKVLETLDIKSSLPISEQLGTVDYAITGTLKNPVVLINNESGFMKKLELIESAGPESTLDLAYFIYEADFTSSFLTQRLLDKAKSGTKIRLLVDYFMTENYKEWLGFIASHPNIEVRRFRPPTKELLSFLSHDLEMQNPDLFIKGLTLQKVDLMLQAINNSKLKPLIEQIQSMMVSIKNSSNGQSSVDQLRTNMLLSMLLDPTKLTIITRKATAFQSLLTTYLRRLHHKILLHKRGDHIEFVVGGRNISDEYHLSAGHDLLKARSYPFIDSETSGVLVASEKSRTLPDTFNSLWMGVEGLYEQVKPVDKDTYDRMEAQMNSRVGQLQPYLNQMKELSNKGRVTAENAEHSVIYAENDFRATLTRKEISEMWVNGINKATKGDEVEIISAYFFLFPEVYEAIKGAIKRGATFKVYTNSYFTTDLNIVNLAFYKNLSKWLKDLGGPEKFKIFELGLQKGQGSLHVKMIRIKDKLLGVGSANFDWRTHLFDSNNMVFFDLEESPSLGDRIVNAYIKNYGQFAPSGDLPWVELTLDKANAFLEQVKKSNPSLYHSLSLVLIQQQI